MNKLLPVVDGDVGHSIARSLEYDHDYFKQQLKKLNKENPVISEFVTRWSQMYTKNSSIRLHVAMCGILVYKLLESQAEADYMTKELKLS